MQPLHVILVNRPAANARDVGADIALTNQLEQVPQAAGEKSASWHRQLVNKAARTLCEDIRVCRGNARGQIMVIAGRGRIYCLFCDRNLLIVHFEEDRYDKR